MKKKRPRRPRPRPSSPLLDPKRVEAQWRKSPPSGKAAFFFLVPPQWTFGNRLTWENWAMHTSVGRFKRCLREKRNSRTFRKIAALLCFPSDRSRRSEKSSLVKVRFANWRASAACEVNIGRVDVKVGPISTVYDFYCEKNTNVLFGTKKNLLFYATFDIARSSLVNDWKSATWRGKIVKKNGLNRWSGCRYCFSMENSYSKIYFYFNKYEYFWH